MNKSLVNYFREFYDSSLSMFYLKCISKVKTWNTHIHTHTCCMAYRVDLETSRRFLFENNWLLLFLETTINVLVLRPTHALTAVDVLYKTQCARPILLWTFVIKSAASQSVHYILHKLTVRVSFRIRYARRRFHEDYRIFVVNYTHAPMKYLYRYSNLKLQPLHFDREL